MAKRVDIDGKSYRRRRGKLVEIPPEWIGQVTDAQTIRKRPSKKTHKLRKETKLGTDRKHPRHGRPEPTNPLKGSKLDA